MRGFIRSIRTRGWRVGGARESNEPNGDAGIGRLLPGSRPRRTRGQVGLAALLVVGVVILNLALAPAIHGAPSVYTVTDCTSANAAVSGTGLNLDTALTNAQTNGGGVINFNCNSSGAQDLHLDKTLDITTISPLTIDGTNQQVALDGGGIVQDIEAQSGANLALDNLTIQGGIAAGNGGAIDNEGSAVNLINITIIGSQASSGGGIYNSGQLTLDNSSVINNTASNFGGGIYNDGGGVLTVTSSAFAFNQAQVGGGGIFNNGGAMSVSTSAFAFNQAPGMGIGGGIANEGGMPTVSNSTFAFNQAQEGGGIFSDGVLSLNNSTVAYNTASSSGKGGGLGDITGLDSAGSIVADNSAGGSPNNCAFPIGADQGYNLESGSDCGFTSVGSLQNTNPLLASGLANNGGPTQTLALQSSSPAIDQIPVASCPTIDQRGVSRPDNGETACDIGAYEYQDPVSDKDLALTNVPANLTVNATSPAGAVVTYSPPTVVDEDSPLPTVSCTPASGSPFAIGQTTVTCSVNDSDDSNSPVQASFTVMVLGAAAQVSNLLATVNGMHLRTALQNSYDEELTEIRSEINGGQTANACANLSDFIVHVQGQSGKSLTAAQANQLSAAAKNIQAVLGC